jgi:hypothetical protein
MPNWCSNYMTVSGPYDDVKRFFEEAKGDPNEKGEQDILSFEKHVPMEGPESDWYNEHCNKWGTKWDACDSDIHSEDVIKNLDGTGEICYSFQTAWAPPCEWLAAVVPQFPTLEFEMQYEEPGCEVYGVSRGSNGEFEDEAMTHEEWLMEYNEEYPEYVKEIQDMTPEEIVKYFSGIKNFTDCCQDCEEWPQALTEDKDWGGDMYEFDCLAKIIIPKIDVKDLPKFINVDWGYGYNDLFKQRLAKGE